MPHPGFNRQSPGIRNCYFQLPNGNLKIYSSKDENVYSSSSVVSKEQQEDFVKSSPVLTTGYFMVIYVLKYEEKYEEILSFRRLLYVWKHRLK